MRGRQVAVHITHLQVHLYVLHCCGLVAVVHGQRATECLTGHHVLLLEGEGDSGADGG